MSQVEQRVQNDAAGFDSVEDAVVPVVNEDSADAVRECDPSQEWIAAQNFDGFLDTRLERLPGSFFPLIEPLISALDIQLESECPDRFNHACLPARSRVAP